MILFKVFSAVLSRRSFWNNALLNCPLAWCPEIFSHQSNAPKEDLDGRELYHILSRKKMVSVKEEVKSRHRQLEC